MVETDKAEYLTGNERVSIEEGICPDCGNLVIIQDEESDYIEKLNPAISIDVINYCCTNSNCSQEFTVVYKTYSRKKNKGSFAYRV